MGLKWFRARIKIGKSAKQPLGVAGFYRKISQFDESESWPPVPNVVPQPRVISVTPEVSTLNSSWEPGASLEKHENVEEIVTDEKQEGDKLSKDENEFKTPCIDLPRESVELMRSGILENNSTRQKVNKMKKSEMKKKSRVPLPRSTTNNNATGVMQINDVRHPQEHEFEI